MAHNVLRQRGQTEAAVHQDLSQVARPHLQAVRDQGASAREQHHEKGG